MAVPSSRRSSGPVIRSHSPSGMFHSSPDTQSPSSPAFASYASSFAARSSTSPSAQSVMFSIDRPAFPTRSISAVKKQKIHQKRLCMCSPTTHPGSFRCNLHKNYPGSSWPQHSIVPQSSNRLNVRRSAMKNSLIRIGTVEGDLVKCALAALIRPSSHHQRRRAGFQPKASRLSIMSITDQQL